MALLPAGMHHRLEVGREAVAARRLTVQRGLAPKHEAAEVLLGVVVGGLDDFLADRAPQRRLVLEDVVAV